MMTNVEAESRSKPSRQVWRQAVIAHINLSTVTRQKHHKEEQERPATPNQVAYNEQDVVEPAPVHLDGTFAAIFVENLETVAEEMGILHPNAMDSNDLSTSEDMYDSIPITQPAVLGQSSVSSGAYLVSPSASLLVDLDYGYNQANEIQHQNSVPQFDAPGSSNGERSEQTSESSSQWFARLFHTYQNPSDQNQSPFTRHTSTAQHKESHSSRLLDERCTWNNLDDRSEQVENSSNEGLVPPHNTPVDSGDVSSVNTPAPAPSLDRGPSIRLQKALAEDQEAWEPLKKPINELVVSSEPLPPSGTQNSLLQAAERAGVWRNDLGIFFAEEERKKLVQNKYDSEVNLVRRLRAGLETKIEKRPCYLLWLEERHQLSTERMLTSATTRLADYAEGYKAISLRELCRKRGHLGDSHGQVPV
ncbi:hypothetical protein COL5a_004283 [Colletotrichum fioriniae]|nr:uncharacterized protein COL516b_005570 [Colletotrichum fioriniae]KAJ0304794.1 hypothetical protein COL516b_005570 [Colletotrichum fioriniae]KAJ0329054.1 hypothetical protein COL5a_004283 [Colletotrichum fioriniae]